MSAELKILMFHDCGKFTCAECRFYSAGYRDAIEDAAEVCMDEAIASDIRKLADNKEGDKNV